MDNNNEQKSYFVRASDAIDETHAKWIVDAEAVKQLLYYCCAQPGATITVSVKHDNGNYASAELYDLAAFVCSLLEALECFQEELL